MSLVRKDDLLGVLKEAGVGRPICLTFNDEQASLEGLQILSTFLSRHQITASEETKQRIGELFDRVDWGHSSRSFEIKLTADFNTEEFLDRLTLHLESVRPGHPYGVRRN